MKAVDYRVHLERKQLSFLSIPLRLTGCFLQHNAKQLVIRNDAKRGTVVAGLEELKVTNPEEIFKILEKSCQKRTTAETLLNKESR